MTADFETFRDPTLSMFQSLVDEVARKLEEEPKGIAPKTRAIRRGQPALRRIATDIALRETGQKPTAGVLPAPQGIGNNSKFCAELALRYIKALATGNEEEKAAVSADYTGSTCDAAWLNTLKEYHAYFGASGSKQIPYVRASKVGKTVIPMKAGAKVAIVGDWGTGAQPALDVLNAIAQHEPDVLIHLGDIYYSGTPTECDQNFLGPVNEIIRKNHACTVYSLSGNHDMYCGGLGYYDLISKLNPTPFIQEASFFCLRAEDNSWQFLAMDTGLHDHSPYSVTDATTWIEEDELEWLCERVKEFDGKTILLSHHQMFSAFSTIGSDRAGSRSAVNPNLLKAFEALSSYGSVEAWFWGHEHSLTVYKAFAGLKRGRCVGNGAIPVSKLENIYGEIQDLPEAPEIVPKTMLSSTGETWNRGFAILKLSPDGCDAAYYQISNKTESLVYGESF